MLPRILALLLSLSILDALMAQGTVASNSAALSQTTVTDPNYVLITGDTLSIQVLDEPELIAGQLIDKDGLVRIPLLGDLAVVGLSVRNAEQLIEKAYVEQELLKRPQVRINVVNYAPRLISILGAVKSPGKVSFSRDNNTIDIVDAITQAGGFTPAARKDQVSVTRTNKKGVEENFVVDVDSMISGKRKDKPREFALLPGDKLFVPERIF